MKTIYRVLGLTAFLFALSCNLDEDLKNPNELGVDEANAALIMNKVQLELSDFYSRVSGSDTSTPASGVTFTQGVDALVRMNALTNGNTYERAITPQNMDEIWNLAYQGILVNIETLIPLAEEEGFTEHVGIAKVIKAYVYLTLVDLYGDVPYTQAIKGTELNFNPGTDTGAMVYADMIALLDEAKTDLAATPAVGGALQDLYYGGNRTRWTTLANSLQLKAHLNMGNAAAITALIAANDFIDTDAEEFAYKYGTANIPIRSRHPQYRQYYRPQLGAGAGYVNNYYLKQLYNGSGVQDPRWRYYFYRQVGSIPRALQVDNESVPCVLEPIPIHYSQKGSPYCVFEPGFFGRDHGDAAGGPPDSNVLTTTGVYPAGGRVDTNNGNANYWEPTQQGQGGNGAGIEPMYMSWFTDFMLAESAIRLGTPGDPKALMLSGISKSINRVKNFATSLGQTLPADLEPSTVTYTIAVSSAYDAPGSDELDIVAKEYYKSLYGNGIEAYNLYRRTSSPKDIQPMRGIEGGVFFRSLLYPAVFVNLNNSTAQKTDNAQKVFWDTNPDKLN